MNSKHALVLSTALLAFIAGFSFAEVIHGSGGDDSLTGTTDADTITGHAGDDHIEGLEGNDDLMGGCGSDWVDGNHGDDTLSGGPGTDTILDKWGATTVWDGEKGEGADGDEDTIDVSDGEGDDVVNCGPEDKVIADPDDRIKVHNKSGGFRFTGSYTEYLTWKEGLLDGHSTTTKHP